MNLDGLLAGLDETFSKILSLSQEGPIYVWGGGSTKEVLFCHHLKRLHPELFNRIKKVIDINSVKQGKFLPSSHIPIISEKEFVSSARGDELILIMNPNYEKEILSFLAQHDLKKIKHLSV